MDRSSKGSVFQVDIAETNGTGINVSVLTLIYVKWGEGKGLWAAAAPRIRVCFPKRSVEQFS